jgi:hypothetical protein
MLRAQTAIAGLLFRDRISTLVHRLFVSYRPVGMLRSGFASAALAERMVLLLGAPRSGTTWLGKIFDSHPDVLYRHEPDMIDRGDALPKVVAVADIARWSAEARSYLLRLAELGRPKLPLFRKSYRPAFAHCLYAGEVHLLRLLARLPGGEGLAARVPVPDLAARPPRRVAIKSVSSCGCAGLYAAALPEAPIVFLIRAPFGQVASMLQGTRLGKLDGVQAVQGLWDWPEAARYGLSKTVLTRLPLVEQLTWHWVVLNEKAMADLADRPAVRVLAYRDLRADPERQARALFAFAGLDWSAQTAAFLDSSTRFTGRDRYFEVQRNTSVPEAKWRSVLSVEDRARIVAIVRQSTLVPFLDPEAEAGVDPAPASAP